MAAVGEARETSDEARGRIADPAAAGAGKAVVILGRPEFRRLIGAIVEENLRDARAVSDEG